MSDLTYRFEVRFGSIEMGRVIGIVTDPDGWQRFAMSDTIWLDRYGREERREPTPTFVRWRHDADEPRPSMWRQMAAFMRRHFRTADATRKAS